MALINFVGDIALFREFQRRQIDPFAKIKLPESDYNIGNFEFIIPNKRGKKFFDVSDEYKVDYDYFENLKLNKFQAFGLANNHAMDYGRDGAEDVIDLLHKKQIAVFGIGERDFTILRFSVKGIEFAVIGCVKDGRWIRAKTFSPDLCDSKKIITKIQEIKKYVDHVIVYPHMGTELVDIPAPKDVIIARSFVDAGASAVIGHHPHIIQGIEMYKNCVIAYSLGSFIYIPSFELGYSKSQASERDFSICLSLKFSKNNLESIKPYFYKFDNSQLIPILFNQEIGYFMDINQWVDQPKMYYEKVRKQLLKREIRSFLQRLKKSPFKTIKHYASYVKPKHFNKIFRSN